MIIILAILFVALLMPCFGYKQEYGMNYAVTFALVAMMILVRTILFIATFKSWSLHQIDVKNVFLHGDLI